MGMRFAGVATRLSRGRHAGTGAAAILRGQTPTLSMNNSIFYIIGVIVVVVAILKFAGLW